MKKSKLEKSRNRWGIVFILPQLISLVCLGIIPIVIAFVLSFFDWNGFSAPVFTGFQNFKAVFTDPDTGIAIKNTLVYSVIYVPCSIVLSLGLAMLLNKAWGKMFYRAVFFLPQIVTSVGIAVVWSWIYQPQFGILNMILRFFGIEGKEWLRDPSTAMGAVIVMSIWWGLGTISCCFWPVFRMSPGRMWRQQRLTVQMSGRYFSILQFRLSHRPHCW